LAGLFLTVPRLAVPAFAQIFIDEILIPGRQEWLRPLLLGMAITAIVQGLLVWLQLTYLRRLIVKLSVSMKGQFLWHVLRLPLGFYAQRLAGDISNRVGLNDKVVNVLSQIANTVIDSVMLIFYAAIMFLYDQPLTWITIGFAALNLLALQRLRRFRVAANLKLAQEQGQLSGIAIGSIRAIETVKASGIESYLFSKLSGLYAKVLNAEQELSLQTQILTALPTLLTSLATTSVLVFGGFRVMSGDLSIGMLVAYQSLVQNFLKPINNLINFGSTLQELEAYLERLDDVLQNPIDPEIVPETNRINPITSDNQLFADSLAFRLQGHVEIRHVSFGYSRLEPSLIEDFNLTVKSGQRVAIVGKSGSGKSTIARLLAGLYRPWEGEIFFDGTPRSKISRSVLSASIAVVEQDIFLFAGTVRENLTLWNPTIPASDLVRACRDAAIHELIVSLPGGYDAQLSEAGTNLSGGERQRLEIARALVRNPTLLVLDEATSALDPQTELTIDRNLRRRGCTCIIVAHRLSTIRDCDEIVVLEHGKVLERGTHEELWQRGGAYAHLISAAETEEKTVLDSQSEQKTAWKVHPQNEPKQLATLPQTSLVEVGNRLARFDYDWMPDVECLKGNKTLPLDDPRVGWVVQSGSLTLFANKTVLADERMDRRYLLSIQSDEMIFGIQPLLSSALQEQWGILAVTTEETVLRRLTILDLANRVAIADPKAIALLKGWVERIIQLVSIESQSNIQVVQVIQALGSNYLSLLRMQARQPLSETQLVLVGLAYFHQCFLHRLRSWMQREQEEEILRAAELEQLNTQLTEQALSGLVAVLEPDQNSLFQPGKPLLVAAGAVCRAMGITMRSPVETGNPRRQDPVAAIAQASQFPIRQVALKGDWWHHEHGPLLGFAEGSNCPVALLPGRNGRYVLFDPIHQHRTVMNPAVAQSLASDAYMFYRPLPQIIRRATGVMQFAIQGYEKDIAAVIAVGVIGTLLGMVVPQATALLVSNAIPDSDRLLLWQLGLALFAAALGKSAFQLAQGILALRVENAADGNLQTAVFDRLLKLAPGFFRRYTSGDLLVRLLAIDQIRSLLSDATQRTLLSGFFSLLNVGLMLAYSPQLTFIALITTLVTVGVTITSGILLVRIKRLQTELGGEITGLTVQLIHGLQKLRVAVAEERAFATWAKKFSQQTQLMSDAQQIQYNVQVINEVFPLVTSMLLYGFAAQFLQIDQTGASPGGVTMGVFLAFNAAFGIFISGVGDLSNTVANITGIVPLWERAQPILQATPEFDPNKTSPGDLQGHIRLDQVCFRYRDEGSLVIDEVTIQAKPGEFVAIVGPSGSGKSTLFRLLLGFETPLSGTVYYDGQDLAWLDVQAVRQQLGVVLQNSRVMRGSIFNNITCGGIVSLDEAWEAAHMAGLADDILKMPMGMYTVVNETGGNFSVGQQQRLLIARALISKPRIVLMDEATSALDNQTQAIVTNSLAQLNATRIVIAHRLSTIRNADRIYVMELGRVVQIGSFEELLNQDGLFSQLAVRQLL
jgi:NHLM bacteriocin system ABC transporter ATP-binding protein/NHLM bacteriocin system ABC transporter peptidase/ATP-binding protein